MATLTVTAKGQITLKQELLRHLNVSPARRSRSTSCRTDGSSCSPLRRPAQSTISSAASSERAALGLPSPKSRRSPNKHGQANDEDHGGYRTFCCAQLYATTQNKPSQPRTFFARPIWSPCPSAALCEFAWVTRSAYKWPDPEVARSIRSLIASPNVATNLPAVEAGLAVLDKGGDLPMAPSPTKATGSAQRNSSASTSKPSPSSSSQGRKPVCSLELLLLSPAIAAEAETQRRANLAHAAGVQLPHSSSQPFL